jgi:hypothetical protein
MQNTLPRPVAIPASLIVFLLIIFGLYTILTSMRDEAVTASTTNYSYVIKGTSHGVTTHGVDILSAYECLDKNGSSYALKYIEPGKNESRINWLCFDGKDWWVLVTNAGKGEKGIDRVYSQRTVFPVEMKVYKTIDGYIDYLMTGSRKATIIYEVLKAGEGFYK